MTRRVALLSAVLLCAAGCDSADGGLLDVEGGLVLDLVGAEPAEGLSVVLRTTGTYPCSNYEIVLDDLVYDDEQLALTASGVYAPDLCMRAVGPASVTLGLSAAADDGYRITVTGPGLPRGAYALVADGARFRLDRL